MIQQSVLAHETPQSAIFVLQIELKIELRIIFEIEGNKYFQAIYKANSHHQKVLPHLG
jgi:hypothetical protein